MSDWTNDGDDLDLGFDPAEIVREPSSFDPLPAGPRLMRVDHIELKPTKDGMSTQFVVTLVVPDGEEYAGRKVWDRLTKATKKPTRDGSGLTGMGKSLAMGQQKCCELMEAAGVGGASLSPCIGEIVEVKLKVRPAAGGYDASNDVQGYRRPGGAPAAPAAKAASKPGAPKPAAKAAPAFLAKKKAPAVSPEPDADDADEQEADGAVER